MGGRNITNSFGHVRLYVVLYLATVLATAFLDLALGVEEWAWL